MNRKAECFDVIEDQTDLNINGITIPLYEEAIIIIGAGPVGMHLVSELARFGTDKPVIIYGDEPYKPYNRVRLSDYLSGGLSPGDIALSEIDDDKLKIEYRYGCRVVEIDTERRNVVDAQGQTQQYSKLIFATGSSPYIPKIGNSFFKGVYTFRTLAEADELLTRKLRSRHTVIIGGGLLGLETARAMQRFNTRITIVEHNRWLMMQQLDQAGSEVLQDYVIENNINLILADGVVSVTGNNRVEGITLRSGKNIKCDTLIIAAGVKPNTNLALEAGVSCGKAIRINNQLESSVENIYAVGECAEHNETVYGIVAPGLEQASVLANNLCGGAAEYTGSVSSTKLKVLKKAVISAGRTGVHEDSRTTVKEYVYKDKNTGVYRKIRVFGNRIIGALAVGDWHESALLNEAIENRKKVWLWQLVKFQQYGYLWGSEEDVDVSTWPASSKVCNCNHVTRGELTSAIKSGCSSVECLSKETRAGSVCGSCKPLLVELLGSDSTVDPVKWWQTITGMTIVSAVLVLMFLLVSKLPYPDSVQVGLRWDELWRNGLFKQISGFSILALVIVGLTISLRKRTEKIAFGKYDTWRMVHISLGVLSLMVLVAHTGFSLGHQLNFILMMNFLLLAAVGAYAGKAIAWEHKLSPKLARKNRAFWNGLHIVLVWSFPVLLSFHIFKSYYY